MERSTSLVLLSLAAFLVLFPLTLVKPGWPAGLKADEPAYYLMALSLAHDFDLRVEPHDLRRLFDEFPDHITRNVILMTDDGWQTVYFGKPYLYSLLAAPAARFFGANALISLNMALYLGMIALGMKYLRRHNPDGLALLFSAGFFLLSMGFAYIFWMQPEVFNMAAITLCLYLGLVEGNDSQRFRRRWLSFTTRPALRLFFSCAALGLAVYNKPMLAAMGLPVFYVLASGKRFRDLGIWLLGGAVSLALAMGVATAFTGHPSAYLGVARAGVKICSPHEMPIKPLPPPPTTAEDTGSDAVDPPEKGSLADERRASWSWLLRIPPFDPPQFAEHLGYFFWGRHTGLFLYAPFSLLAIGLFLVHGRRSGMRWVLVGALAIVGLFFLLFIPFNWHGGGGFVGNRYFVNVYPGFLFLVTRIVPSWTVVMAYAAGSLLLGPTIFSPLGRVVPFPTMQAHVRNFPFPLFPLELSIKGIPGYHDQKLGGARLRGRKDVFLPRGNRAWTSGATTTELWLQTPEPVTDLLFKVASPAASNEIVLRLGDTEERLVWSAGETDDPRRVTFRPSTPTRTIYRQGAPRYFYRLDVMSRTGEVREWTQHYPPRDCFYFPYAETSVETFYVGAEISYLGSASVLAKNVYDVKWARTEAPAQVVAGEAFTVRTRVRNKSAEAWPVEGVARVNLSYHWENENGTEVVKNGLRTQLEKRVDPGTLVDREQKVEAPIAPGRYVLVLDLVYEEVAWFSAKNGDNVRRLPVEVTAPPP